MYCRHLGQVVGVSDMKDDYLGMLLISTLNFECKLPSAFPPSAFPPSAFPPSAFPPSASGHHPVYSVNRALLRLQSLRAFAQAEVCLKPPSLCLNPLSPLGKVSRNERLLAPRPLYKSPYWGIPRPNRLLFFLHSPPSLRRDLRAIIRVPVSA
jgi:hypothetical protein